jgi:hypothetical protein
MTCQLTLTAVAVFDQDAGIFHYEEAGGAGLGRGVLVVNSQLHPDNFCANDDGAVYDWRNVLCAPKDVDNFDALRFRDIFKARVTFFAEDFGFVGIYRDDAIAGGLHVLGDAETRTSGIGREPDYRDGFIVFEDVGDGVVTAWPAIGDGCFHGDEIVCWRLAKLSRCSMGVGTEGLVRIFPFVRVCRPTGIG